MRHFHAALRQECPTLVPRTFPNVPLDDAHNVQSHATDMRVLDVARERLRAAEAQRQLERQIMAARAEEAAARDRLSPEISVRHLIYNNTYKFIDRPQTFVEHQSQSVTVKFTLRNVVGAQQNLGGALTLSLFLGMFLKDFTINQ